MQTSLPLWQLVTVVAVPTLMVFLGILTNRHDASDLRAEIRSLSTQLHSDMMMIQSVLRDHEGRISGLESR